MADSTLTMAPMDKMLSQSSELPMDQDTSLPSNILLNSLLTNNKNSIHSKRHHIDQYMDDTDYKKRKISHSLDDNIIDNSELTFSTIDDDILPIPIESLLLELSEQNFDMEDPIINETFLRDRISSTDIEEWANQMT